MVIAMISLLSSMPCIFLTQVPHAFLHFLYAKKKFLWSRSLISVKDYWELTIYKMFKYSAGQQTACGYKYIWPEKRIHLLFQYLSVSFSPASIVPISTSSHYTGKKEKFLAYTIKEIKLLLKIYAWFTNVNKNLRTESTYIFMVISCCWKPFFS